MLNLAHLHITINHVPVILTATAAMVRTAYLGGQIRHPEARPGFVAPPESEG